MNAEPSRASSPEPVASRSATAEVTEDRVREALRSVIDPEIGLDIITLGLVYDIEVRDASVTVTFTLTTPGCPLERHITNGIARAVLSLDGVDEVIPKVVWEPAWHPGLIQEDAW